MKLMQRNKDFAHNNITNVFFFSSKWSISSYRNWPESCNIIVKKKTTHLMSDWIWQKFVTRNSVNWWWKSNGKSKKKENNEHIQSDKEVNLFLINSCSIAQNLSSKIRLAGSGLYSNNTATTMAPPHNDGVEWRSVWEEKHWQGNNRQQRYSI